MLFQLFSAFFRIGLFTFGGGYSMLPMLEAEVVKKHAWATTDELLDYFALGQCMPGLIAANVAVLIGYRQKKLKGAFFSMLGVVLPSLIIITLIAAALKNFAHLPLVQHAFRGIRAAVAALIFGAFIKLFKANVLSALKPAQGKIEKGIKSHLQLFLPPVLCLCAFILITISPISPVYIVLGAALLGMFFLRGCEI